MHGLPAAGQSQCDRAIGLVENMPDGNAQRRAISSPEVRQAIEIINTDARRAARARPRRPIT